MEWLALSDFGRSGLQQSVVESSYILPVIAVVVGIALIVIIILVSVQLGKGQPTKLVKGPIDLFAPSSPVVVDRPTASSTLQSTYTLSFYLMIDAVPDMRVAATPLLTWPNVWNLGYNAAQEQLVWDFQQTPDRATMAQPESVILTPIPMQKWTQIAITSEGRTVDMYVNGVLTTSSTLSNLTPSVNSSITIVPGDVMGQIAYVQVWPRRLRVSEIANNYRDTSDSQGRPFVDPGFFKALTTLSVPNLFCPNGDCAGSKPAANPSQTWEFPYQ
jgi:hypothetical protein